jgi:hypothetical protein
LAHDGNATQTWERGYKVGSASWSIPVAPFFVPPGIVALGAAAQIRHAKTATWCAATGNSRTFIAIVWLGTMIRAVPYKVVVIYKM